MAVDKKFASSGEMVAASLRGYRSWSLRRSHTRVNMLCAVSVGHIWDSKKLSAECKKLWYSSEQTQHESPHDGCTCGIYGWYEPENAMAMHTGPIVGAVEYSGRLLMGTMGFRAQKAEIVAITVGKNKNVLGEMCKNLEFLSHVLDFMTAKYNSMEVDYGSLQKYLKEMEKSRKENILSMLQATAEHYGIEAYETVDELKEAYPPQLDTVQNVLGI